MIPNQTESPGILIWAHLTSKLASLMSGACDVTTKNTTPDYMEPWCNNKHKCNLGEVRFFYDHISIPLIDVDSKLDDPIDFHNCRAGRLIVRAFVLQQVTSQVW